ncbi:hypothetical protein HBNCFIEN_00538 [Legionella sp. PC997]|nr:hypothetical protein HBNCFIEN_00538 [Legionella sp. PC997]
MAETYIKEFKVQAIELLGNSHYALKYSTTKSFKTSTFLFSGMCFI